ncbi:MAG: extracellular solute-binding protein [Clostridiales bacterium]|nr:extracellular solute-binding protein [Clostridiales bacterium]
MTRAIIAILVIALISASAIGCAGNQAPAPAQTQAPAPAAEKTAAPAAAAEKTEAPAPAAPRVKIRVPVYDRSKEGYPAVDDNYWTKYIQTEFGDPNNIDVEYVPIPRNDVMATYSVLISGKQSPTIMMEYDYPKVAQWANDGAMQVIDLNAFKAAAPTYYQAMVDNSQLGYTDINGKTYFVLSERPYYNTTFTYASFIRLDWIEQLGLSMPKNYAEYTNLVDKIIEAKLTDIAPLGLGLPSSAYAQNYYFRNQPVDETEWAIHSSLGTASLPWEATKKMLKRLNTEYSKGWYSREFELDSASTGGSDQMQTDFINGKSLQYGSYMSASVNWLTAFYENNPGAKLAVLSSEVSVEPGVVDQIKIRADNPFGMIVGFSSQADAAQLEASWKLMEWMIQEDSLFALENGVEGVTYVLDANGLPVTDNEYRGPEMLNHNNNIDMTCLVHASKKVGTIEQTIAAISPQGLPQDFTQELIDNYYYLKKLADDGRAYSDPVFAVAIEAESEYTATLLSLWQEYYVALVKADPSQFEALYADYSSKYLDAGYQEVIDERLEAYKAGSTTKLPK